MKTSINLLFYPKKQKNYQGGPTPIYVRITVNGVRAEIATGKNCDSKRWKSETGRMSGNKEDAKLLNSHLDALYINLQNVHSELVRTGQTVTAETIKHRFSGRITKPRFLLDVINDHNNRMEALVGQEYAPGTLKRYKVLKNHTAEFLKVQFGALDYDIQQIDVPFVADYEFHLKSSRKMGNNAVVKHMKMFRKIINICLNNSWITKDPFSNFRGKYRKVDKPVLTDDDIASLSNKKFVSARLDQIRDTFLFCCYTGLSYSDIQKLKPSQIARGIDWNQWIFTSRTKTDVPSHIPLLRQAVRLIEKYSNHPRCIAKDVLFPVPSNQKMNEYLKEIAVVCGITKTLTSHVARHTFATTITLQNGVPIETVSKMLGHTNIRTTQIYAKILDTKVSEDMLLLTKKINKLKRKPSI